MGKKDVERPDDPKSEPGEPVAPQAKGAATEPASKTAPRGAPGGAPEGVLASAEEPIEAEFEPADTVLSRILDRQVSMPIALALAAAASVLGGVFGVIFDGGGAGVDAAQIDAVVDRRLTDFDARLDDLRQTMLETDAEGGGVAAAALGDLETEVSVLRDELGAATSRLRLIESSSGNEEATAAVAAQLDALEADLADTRQLAEEALAAPNAQTAEITALTARVDALSETTRAQGRAINELAGAAGDIAGRITGVRAPTGLATSGAAAALALAGLQEAAAAGGPFPREAATARAYFAESEDMDALAALAESGAPTAAELAVSFRSAARAARDAEKPKGGGAVDRLGRAVTGLVTVRRLDAPPTDSVDDVLVRAQRALTRDDLSGAAAELERLDGPAGAAVATWVAEAKARAEIDARLENLRVSFSED